MQAVAPAWGNARLRHSCLGSCGIGSAKPFLPVNPCRSSRWNLSSKLLLMSKASALVHVSNNSSARLETEQQGYCCSGGSGSDGGAMNGGGGSRGDANDGRSWWLDGWPSGWRPWWSYLFLRAGLLFAAASLWGMVLCSLPTPVLAANDVQPSSTPSAMEGGASSKGVAATSDNQSVRIADPKQRSVRDDINALKRLQREVFADLVAIKQRLEDLAPKPEDEDTVVPFEGVGVAPVLRRVASAVRYKCKAQLSGSMDFSLLLPWTQDPSTSSALAGLAKLGVAVQPAPAILVQSMWRDMKQTLNARLAPEPAGNGGSGDSHGSNGGGGGSGGLQVQQLLYRKEVSPRFKVLLAPMGGTLENISRRINPYADFGMTSMMQHGHDIPAALEGGTGAAATLIRGPLSATAGHFMSGDAGRPRKHSALQLSLHTPLRLAASLLVSSTSVPQPQRVTAPLTDDDGSELRPLRCLGLVGPSCITRSSSTQAQAGGAYAAGGSIHGGSIFGGSMHGASSRELQTALRGSLKHSSSSQDLAGGQQTATPRRTNSLHSFRGGPAYLSALRVGLAGTCVLGDAAVLSAWASQQVTADREAAGPLLGGSGGGIRISSLPDVDGAVIAAAVGRPAGWVVNSVGVPQAPPLVCEVSASLPLADGVCLTPGVVLLRQDGRSTIGMIAKTTWRF